MVVKGNRFILIRHCSVAYYAVRIAHVGIWFWGMDLQK